jgi:Tfp pilus assembly protein PilO
MVLPKQAALQAKKVQIQKLQEDKGKIDGEIAGLNASVKALSASKDDINEMDEALPLDSRTTKLQMLIQYLSGQAGVSLESVSFEEDSKKVYAADKEAIKNPFAQPHALKKISGSVAVLGSFEQVQEFIGKIEKSSRVLNIVSMDLGLQEDNIISLKLDLEAYSYE